MKQVDAAFLSQFPIDKAAETGKISLCEPYEQNIPLGHHGDAEDIANLVAFLSSDKAKFITGQAINVDGGMVKYAF